MSFKSKMAIEYDGMIIDSKRLINIFALKIPKQSQITVLARGHDEELAVEERVKLITSF